jgi:hypothetical protein
MSINKSHCREVTEYINGKAEFSQPIMHQLRAIIHHAAPEISEVIKWRQPCFEHQGLVCGFAAFKAHVNLSFFKGKSITDQHNIFSSNDNNELTTIKFMSVADIPSEAILTDYIQQAITLNQPKNKAKKKVIRKDKSTLLIPTELKQALAVNTEASKHFSNFSYSKQKDYIDWINSAKRDATKATRLKTAIEWIAEGKSRNWKYENC